MNEVSNSNQKKNHQDINKMLVGGGEMGERIRSYDWSKTSIGKIAKWPSTLRTSVNIILQSPAPMVILWGKEGITFYNNAYISFAGKRHPELLGKSCEEIWPEAAPFIRNVINNSFEGKSLTYTKFPYKVYRNGHAEDIWMNLDCSTIYGEDGSPTGVLIINIEITEQVLTEKNLKEAEEHFEVAMDAAEMVGTYNWDLQSNIISFDSRFGYLFSIEPDKGKSGMLFSDYLSAIHPDDLDRVNNAIDQAILTGQKFSEEYRILQKEESIRWVLDIGRCFYDEQNVPLNFSGVVVDITERKQIENNLQASQNNFSSIFNQTSVGIGQTDLEGNFILVNNRYCEIVGRSKEELNQMSLFDITAPVDLDKNKQLINKLLQDGTSFKIEKRYVRPDGLLVWVHMNVSSVRDQEGAPLYLLGVCQDITERKLSEEALKESEERFRTLADQSPMIVFLVEPDEQATMSYFNKTWLKYTGQSFEQAIGLAWNYIVHPDDLQSVFDIYVPAFQNRQSFKLPAVRLKRHDGIYRWHLFKGNPRYLPNGKFAGFIGVGIDIHELKEAEETLRESETRFKIMADSSPSHIWILDENAQMVYFNKTFLNYVGLPEDFKGIIPWEDFIPEDNLEKLKAIVSKAFNERAPIRTEHKIKRFDGEVRWVMANGNPWIIKGEFKGYIGSNIDITDRKEAEKSLELKNAELVRINNDLDNFIYTASHDLKAPIINIEGLVKLLNKTFTNNKTDPQIVKPLFEMIDHSIGRFKNTIKDLTEVAKVQSNVDDDLSEVHFKDLLDEVLLNIQNEVDDANAVVKGDFSQAPSIQFSKKNLRSILYNLISNAIKYRSPERNSTVEVSTSNPDKDHLLLRVQDNGLGIKESDKAKVFTMFKRLHQHVEGTGIGLSIVKKIIDNNGGKIEIESEVGKGTTFKVYFKKEKGGTTSVSPLNVKCEKKKK